MKADPSSRPLSGRPARLNPKSEIDAKRLAAPRATAADLLAEFSVAFITSNPESQLAVFARIDEVSEEMASYFIERLGVRGQESSYGAGNGVDACVTLALAAGGNNVSEYLKLVLRDTDSTTFLGNSVRRGLGGVDSYLANADHIPVDSELQRMALDLVRSNDRWDRKAGLGLLGACKDSTIEGELQRLLISDSDWGVRAAAARALGNHPSKSTLELLRSQLQVVTTLNNPSHQAYVDWLESSIESMDRILNP